MKKPIIEITYLMSCLFLVLAMFTPSGSGRIEHLIHAIVLALWAILFTLWERKL